MKFERMTQEVMDVCLQMLKKSNKSRFNSYSDRNSVLIISHITFRDCCVHFFFPTTFLEIAVYISLRRTPWDNLLKQLLKANRVIPETQGAFDWEIRI